MKALNFDPLLPWPLIGAIALLAVLVMLWSLWRSLRGWFWRGLAGLAAALALAGPALETGIRNALSDIVILLDDRSASQSLPGRAAQTDAAIDTLTRQLEALPGTEIRRVTVGDDPDAAELAGVQTSRVLIQVYALAGLFCAIAGWVMIGRFGSVSPSASTGQLGNIQSITAVVIGGISLFGGRGSIVGMFFGAMIVGVFEMGLKMVGTDPQWTFFLIGLLIILAVAVDQWIRKASA